MRAAAAAQEPERNNDSTVAFICRISLGARRCRRLLGATTEEAVALHLLSDARRSEQRKKSEVLLHGVRHEQWHAVLARMLQSSTETKLFVLQRHVATICFGC